MGRFPERTVEMIEKAKEAPAKGKDTKADKLLRVLADGNWHLGHELAGKVSWRFGGYLHILKERGVAWEKERLPDIKDAVVYKYRLVQEEDEDELR